MKIKVLTVFLVLIASALFFSCRAENKQVAVFAFTTAQGVPSDIAQRARGMVIEGIARRNSIVIDSSSVDEKVTEISAVTTADFIRVGSLLKSKIIIVGNIETASRDILERFADSIRGNTWYRIELTFIDVANGTTLATLNASYDTRLIGLDRNARRQIRKIQREE